MLSCGPQLVVQSDVLYWIHIKTLCVCVCVCVCPRIRLPAVPGGELGAGPDWRVHGGGWEALPVCFQPHHQGQTSEFNVQQLSGRNKKESSWTCFTSYQEMWVNLLSCLTVGANPTMEPERQWFCDGRITASRSPQNHLCGRCPSSPESKYVPPAVLVDNNITKLSRLQPWITGQGAIWSWPLFYWYANSEAIFWFSALTFLLTLKTFSKLTLPWISFFMVNSKALILLAVL